MKPEDLFREGKLEEAIRVLGSELRDDPSHLKKRTFLFELLCFAGEYDRAEKQLDLLGDQNNDAMMGSLLYRGALNAERTRQEMFQEGRLPATEPGGGRPAGGKLNGQPFESISDADPRIGAKLEVFAGPDYMWVGFEHIAQLSIDAPKRLRDLMWACGRLRAGPSFKGQNLGEILIPSISAGTLQSDDAEVRLGRATEWCRDESGVEFPLGQKVLLVDGREVPLLEIRTLEMNPQTADVEAAR